jgi:hypothetical protein
MGTTSDTLIGNCMPLLARRPIRDDSYSIYRLTGTARCHNDTQPLKVTLTENTIDRSDDVDGIGETALANISPCQPTSFWLNDMHTAGLQQSNVGLNSRMLPHLGVHRRAHDDRRTSRNENIRKKVG